MEINPNFSEKAQKDYELVLSAVKGNEKAYSEILARYKDAIYFMILKMVNNPIDAEDLTIEAFGKAFKKIDQYSPKYAFSTWLFKIASNNCIDFLRKKRNVYLLLDNDFSDNSNENNYNFNLKSKDLDPAEKLIKEQKKIIMHDLVKKLKPRYRSLIELRFFKEYSYDEIAKELEIPIGTVKAQLFRAKELLYNIFKNSAKKI
jgi:RNA polymerase sigma-70 factor (ECF subfamily)